MATLEKNVLMVKKERTDLILEYPITKMDNIVDMPDSFPPSTHTHDDRYFTETEMNAKLADKAGKVHTHAKADITDFPTALKNPTALTFTGGVTGSYDGSEAKTITIPSSLPASGGNADTVDGKHATDFAASVHTHTKASISDFPASMPASDVSAWAKQQTKPTYTKAEVGLANVTNDAQVKRAEMGVASGIATLDTAGKVPSSQLPSYVDDVLEYETRAGFPTTGETGKIYVDKQSNLTYRWSGTTYVQISPSIALGETASTAYPGDKGKQTTDKVSGILDGTTKVPKATTSDSASSIPWSGITSKPTTYAPSTHTHVKADVGLANVTNDAQVKRVEMGVANGVATLDTAGKVPASQLPSYVDDVLEYETRVGFPTTGEAGKIYVDKQLNLIYRWNGTAYVQLSSTIALGETALTAYAGDKGKQTTDKVNSLLNSVSNENLLINGDFQVWQRGESLTGVLNAYYTADRWKLQTQQATGNINVTRTSTGLKISGITSGYVNVYEPINQVFLDKLKGRKVTFSYSKNNVITTKTFTVPSNATSVAFSADILYVTTVNNDIINWVKLEIGELATPFVSKPYNIELLACQEFFFVYHGGATVAWQSWSTILRDTLGINLWLPVIMRTNTPTVTVTAIDVLDTTSGAMFAVDKLSVSLYKMLNNDLSIKISKKDKTEFGIGVHNANIWMTVDAEIY